MFFSQNTNTDIRPVKLYNKELKSQRVIIILSKKYEFEYNEIMTSYSHNTFNNYYLLN